MPCQFSALSNIDALKQKQKASLNLRTYNEEDSNSREIFDITQTSIKLKSADLMSLKCSKSIGIGPISLGNVYVSATLGSSIDFNYNVKITNEKKIIKTDPNISGGLSLTFKGGLESNPELSEYIFANANLNVAAGTKSIWPYNGDSSKVANYLYVGNTNLSVEGYIDGWLVGGKKRF